MTPSLQTDSRTATFTPRVQVSYVHYSKPLGRVYFDIDHIYPLACTVAEHEFMKQIKTGESYVVDDFSNSRSAQATTPDYETKVEHFSKWDEGTFDSVSVQDDSVSNLQKLDGETRRTSQWFTFQGLVKSGSSFR